MSKEKWQELREELFALLDITYDYSANVATLEQINVRKHEGGERGPVHQALSRRLPQAV
ncbi:hypothetical protein HY768_10270 [candidate division TA06 bacterium]|uniref:Uncharacterized protein n=1 Tax=candidate division TA06 bacterium TaxID=2250710 RepID=A0A933MLJ9_UNCT6|nr:hypothetical protein [candidate division TA06 bacterium]